MILISDSHGSLVVSLTCCGYQLLKLKVDNVSSKMQRFLTTLGLNGATQKFEKKKKHPKNKNKPNSNPVDSEIS